MWFVLAGTALIVVCIGGIYTRRRTMVAIGNLGGSEKVARRVGLAMRWFLFGYPAIFIGFVIISLILGRDSVSLPITPWITWGLSIPFWVSMLVMLQALPFLILLDLLSAGNRIIRKQTIPRRTRAIATLAPLLCFLLYTPIRIAVEHASLSVHTYSVGSGSESLRIVFVGDLQQDNMTGPSRANEFIGLVNKQAADLILSGGDWINVGPDYIGAATTSAGKLQSRLGTFSAEGDHENFAYRDKDKSLREVRSGLAANNVHLLHNEVRVFEQGGKRVAVLFLAYNYIYRTPPDEIRALIAQGVGADYTILVTHQFDAHVAALANDKVDLVLAGHTHGGQVNPVVGFWHVPLARIETKYVEGRYRLSPRTEVIVTAGIGFSLAPFRYASPASIEVIDLHF
tara:strand:+ start:127556 stop:128752 length:1197 start_codon:yes stop_codon:yes gene_type:complete